MSKKLVIIPAYNEEESIRKTVEEIRQKAPDFDFIVINDCSRDRTLDILKENKIKYLSLSENLGIGGAVQTGYLYARENNYDLVVQVDGDGQHDPAFLGEMARLIESGQADMVIGSRFIEHQGFQSSLPRRMGIRYFCGLIRLLTGRTVTDPTSGMRMVNREIVEMFAQKYPHDYPEPETLITVLTKGFRVQEVPVLMRSRSGGVSSISTGNAVYYMIKVSIAMLFGKINGKAKKS